MEIKLRDYQEAAVGAVIEKFKTSRSELVVLPTGCGKTVVLAEVIHRLLQAHPGKSILVLAHREELIN